EVALGDTLLEPLRELQRPYGAGVLGALHGGDGDCLDLPSEDVQALLPRPPSCSAF
ncbi:unnamed protein product, partial [Symbiodinium natans]